mmetsp:Transcript_70821/g.200653  ORF Transcript_70821/g.200653 Transcript_70821/m.200653 type:complete len:276 (+) Transcript_70821:558-1385(+)
MPELVYQVRTQRHPRSPRGMVHDPDMLQSLGSGTPSAGVSLQELPDELLRVLGDQVPVLREERELASLHEPQHLRVVLAVEGRVAAQDHVHDHAAAPEVARVVVLPVENLRGHVERRPCLRLEELAGLVGGGETKVNELEPIAPYGVILGREEEILGLQVPVGHALAMHVVDRAEDLLHGNARVRLAEVPLLDDPVKQLSAVANLHHQVDLVVVLERLKEPNDIGVIHGCVDVHLVDEGIHLGDRGLLDNLHRAAHASLLALRPAHCAEGTSADR